MNIDKWVAVLITANTTLHPGVEKGTDAKSWQSNPCPMPSGIVAENMVTAHQSSPSVAPSETNASAVANARPACPKDSDRARFDDSTIIFWTAGGCFMGVSSNSSTVLFTSAFGLHQFTNPFVFQDKPNPEKRFSAPLGHVYQLGRR